MATTPAPKLLEAVGAVSIPHLERARQAAASTGTERESDGTQLFHMSSSNKHTHKRCTDECIVTVAAGRPDQIIIPLYWLPLCCDTARLDSPDRDSTRSVPGAVCSKLLASNVGTSAEAAF